LLLEALERSAHLFRRCGDPEDGDVRVLPGVAILPQLALLDAVGGGGNPNPEPMTTTV
jgi:hypothetical protein